MILTGGSVVDRESNNSNNLNDLLETLGKQLNEPVMKSTARLIIIISLAINRKLSFTDLLTITSLGKGSLSNHLEKLQKNGLIKIKTVFKQNGPRVSRRSFRLLELLLSLSTTDPPVKINYTPACSPGPQVRPLHGIGSIWKPETRQSL